MKTIKIAVMALTTALILVANPETVFAQSSRKTQKEMQKVRDKQYKEKKRELEKGGWKVSGTANTLGVALLDHYDKLKPGTYQIVGEVENCNSINLCKQVAIANAAREYATRLNSKIRGEFELSGKLNQVTGEGTDDYLSYFAAGVQAEIIKVLQTSFSAVKEKKGGMKSYQTFFIINEDDAHKARLRALETMAKESEAKQEWARGVREYVEEVFNVEN
jgi:hypothetical protein